MKDAVEINVTQPFKYAHRGCEVTEYQEGRQEVPAEVATLALHEKWAEPVKAQKTKGGAPENKDAGQPEENKGQ